jgi:hypothetical protein
MLMRIYWRCGYAGEVRLFLMVILGLNGAEFLETKLYFSFE